MMSVKDMYYSLAGAVKGICDKTYYQDRPTSIDERIDSYAVISLPSAIVNNELDPSGSYNDFTTTVLLEVFVRDNMSACNPIGINLKVMEEKVQKIVKIFPIDTDTIFVTRPEIVMQDNDGSGFHVTLIRARLRTK